MQARLSSSDKCARRSFSLALSFGVKKCSVSRMLASQNGGEELYCAEASNKESTESN